VERARRLARVLFAGVVVAESDRAWRVLETSGPPVYYFAPEDVSMELLAGTESSTFCEWKGLAAYYDLRVGGRVARDAAWTYLRPTPPYAVLAAHVAFYPSRVDACFLDDEAVRPQPGRYYGGWVTEDIVGPFKGDPGTESW